MYIGKFIAYCNRYYKIDHDNFIGYRNWQVYWQIQYKHFIIFLLHDLKFKGKKTFTVFGIEWLF